MATGKYPLSRRPIWMARQAHVVDTCRASNGIPRPSARRLSSSGAEPQVMAANLQPYFIPPTASVSEVTSAASQGSFATEDADS